VPKDANEMTLKQAMQAEKIYEKTGNLKEVRRIKVRIQEKFTLPFACLVFGLIGSSLGSKSNLRSSKSQGFGLSVILILIYYVMSFIFSSFGVKGILPPIFAAWLPVLISLGGGITGDVSGFAASLFKRGLKFVNIPTTLLAQVDSSIGGKTGINSKYGKNLIGSFYQPSLVLSDIQFLNSLSKRNVICGYGEILKHSLIDNKKLFNFLNKNLKKILSLSSPFIEKAIYEEL